MSLMVELQPSLGPALVVGGGTVAARKVRGLLDAGFDVTVVSPELDEGFAELDGYRWWKRSYIDGDPLGFGLVMACTHDREVNRRVGEACRAARQPVLVADAQSESTFYTPAVHRDGELSVAIGTGGASPKLARQLRDQVANALGEGWDERIKQERAMREARLGRGGSEDFCR
ncbi:MAG: bifunctional precorrin-2 dehydrogenase/sirohydrochlorin ferrochelatase [Dehalococcoidia bacterium]|nr:bifunctional precorrin-2 dehydrogenase/sirohydrochlorin ferrochelatase [Dehalococcoidia bacterium]